MNELLDDPDPRIRIQAARAIASYSPERPPAEQEQQPASEGGKPVGLADVVRAGIECGLITSNSEIWVGGEIVRRETPSPRQEVEAAHGPGYPRPSATPKAYGPIP
jgi:hypothetical protein